MGKILEKIKRIKEEYEINREKIIASSNDEESYEFSLQKRILKILDACKELDDNNCFYDGKVFMTYEGEPMLPIELEPANIGPPLVFYQGKRLFQKIIKSVEEADRGKCDVCASEKYCILMQQYLLVAETKTKNETSEIWEKKELNVCLGCLNITEGMPKLMSRLKK